MSFRTKITPEISDYKISHKSKIVSFGSCFSKSIGQQFYTNKFPISINPFGTIYNPLSIFNLLTDVLNETLDFKKSIVEHKSIWSSLLLHSEHSKLSKDELILHFDSIKHKVKKDLIDSNVFFFTFGSAFIYKHIEKNLYVSNCHKISSKNFNQELLSITKISNSFNKFIFALKKVNPHFKIIFTISPVRHLRNGLENNTISKSTLRMAIYEIQQKHSDIIYFPSFELLIDDLRDYRFYKDDLLHPTDFAVQYIWDSLKKVFFDNRTEEIIDLWHKLKSSMHHKPFNLKSKDHQIFLKRLILDLMSFPLDCTKEIALLKKQIS